MSRPRRLKWGVPEQPTPKHPYRDTALVYLGLAVVVVIVAVATGGALVNALVIAGLFWLAATTYGILNWRRKLRKLP